MQMQSPNLLLPWYELGDDNRRFSRILLITLACFFLAGVIVWFYPVPEKTREQKAELPDNLARVILEKKALPKPTPKPTPKPVATPVPTPKPVATPVPTPLPTAKPTARPTPKPAPVATPRPKPKATPVPAPKPTAKPTPRPPSKAELEAKARAAAKAKASKAVSSFADDLASLRDTVDVEQIQAATNSGKLREGKSESTRRNNAAITSGAKTSSGGIDTTKLERSTGNAALAGRQGTQVSSRLADNEQAAEQQRRRITGSGQQVVKRSREDIKKTFDRYKGAIDRIYQRALRKNPALEGAFEVRLTIEPSGEISAIAIVNSELDDKALEDKLLARIRLINFGEDLVTTQTITQLFEFFPR